MVAPSYIRQVTALPPTRSISLSPAGLVKFSQADAFNTWLLACDRAGSLVTARTRLTAELLELPTATSCPVA